MEITEIRQSFVREATIIGDYQILTKTELANGYCKADEEGNELLRSGYWAALMLRYWYKIFEWVQNSKSCKVQIEDYVSWLHNSLYDAFYYRSWWWEYEAVVQHGKFIEWKLDENGNKIPNEHYWKVDPNAPDKSINYFCAARRGKEYQALNKQVRKANMLTYSLDSHLEDTGDYALEKAGATESFEHESAIQYIVEKFLSQGRDIEALIVDSIACQDSLKEVKKSHYEIDEEEVIDEVTGEIKTIETKEKVYDYDRSFDARKVVKHLNTINQEFMHNYFAIEYSIPLDKCDAMLTKLKGLNNTKLYKLIDKVKINIVQDPEMLECLQK